jgi:hypothetical protein
LVTIKAFPKLAPKFNWPVLSVVEIISCFVMRFCLFIDHTRFDTTWNRPTSEDYAIKPSEEWKPSSLSSYHVSPPEGRVNNGV